MSKYEVPHEINVYCAGTVKTFAETNMENILFFSRFDKLFKILNDVLFDKIKKLTDDATKLHTSAHNLTYLIDIFYKIRPRRSLYYSLR
uniref:Uncharacterized protein n=1 Tax=Romanomermis culicivorax TaxID=13658 RepID=A0A915I7C3_ROMCU